MNILNFLFMKLKRLNTLLYKEKDCDVETNVGPNGVKVTIDSGKPGKTIAIRADFDALPIEEQTGLSFASKNKRYACVWP